MVQMEETYKREHPKVTLDSTVLTWGNPYYTKLAMATRAGSPPDVAIMHLTRINQFAPAKLLTSLDLDLLAEHGMTPADFTPAAFAKAHYNGRLVAIPLDAHPFVQYYNTKVCKKAGLLDGLGPPGSDHRAAGASDRAPQAQVDRRDTGGVRSDQRPGDAVAAVLHVLQPGRREGAR